MKFRAQITITWNPENEEETTVTYSEGWNGLLPIEQADNLKDAIANLTEKYNERISKGFAHG